MNGQELEKEEGKGEDKDVVKTTRVRHQRLSLQKKGGEQSWRKRTLGFVSEPTAGCDALLYRLSDRQEDC
jgi:hypothetical protein